MKFLYKDGNVLRFDIGEVEVPDEDPDVEEFLQNKYKEFIFHVKTPSIEAKIISKKSFLKSKISVKDVVATAGKSTIYIDELHGEAAREFFKNIDYFIENPAQTILLPYFPQVDYRVVKMVNLPLSIQYYEEENFYYVIHGLINGIFYEPNTLTVSSYTQVAQMEVSPGKFPDVLNVIFSHKTIEELRKEIDMVSIEADINFSRDIYTLHKIINLPNVLALTVDENDRYYFIVEVRKNTYVRFYTNPKGSSVWAVSTNKKDIQNIDMDYVTFYDYLTKILDETDNTNESV